MFTKAAKSAATVTIEVEGQPLQVDAGISVAAAVLDHVHCRTRVSHTGQERGPYCQMGVCFECLMTINGVPNQQSCLIPVAEGMKIFRQKNVPDFGRKEAPHA